MPSITILMMEDEEKNQKEKDSSPMIYQKPPKESRLKLSTDAKLALFVVLLCVLVTVGGCIV